MSLDILAGLLDEKVLKIINLFIRNPSKKFYLSEVSKQGGVNNTTTFRIVNKFVKEGLVSATVIGKIRIYQLSEGNRVRELTRLISRENVGKNSPLEVFVEKVRLLPRINLVVVDTRSDRSAKLIVVADFPFTERLEKITANIKERFNFKISFIELRPSQFESLKSSSLFNVDKKIIYKK